MSKINRRRFLSVLGALIPSFLMAKAAASPTFSFAPAGNSQLGAQLTQSSKIKVGQTQVYTGKQPSGQTIEVILSRTKKGLIALDGTCTHQGCTVGIKGTQLICPCHGSIFQATSGDVVLGPNGSPKNSIQPLNRYTITEKSGWIWIK